MSYGSIGTGLGAPVGGATPNYGSLSNSPAPAAAGGYDFGSTIDANLALTGVGNILDGVGELAQSGLFGSTGTAPSGSTACPPTSNSTGTSTTDGSSTGYTPPPANTGSDNLSNYGFTSVGGALNDPGTANGAGGLQGFDQLMQGLGNQGTGAGLDEIMNQLNGLVNQLGQQQQAPAPAPAPQADPVANLVNQANVDPQLRNAVTQVAQDPVGNKLLQGAVNDGLAGIQVANLPAGFFGQTLPATKQVQIAPQTLQTNDLVRTIAHELTHAATLGNGDSLNEENIADRLGTQVQQRQTGFGPGYVLGGDAYNGLPQDNGIVNALRLLGITV